MGRYIASSNFSGARAYRHIPHGFRVRFVNKDKGYAQDVNKFNQKLNINSGRTPRSRGDEGRRRRVPRGQGDDARSGGSRRHERDARPLREGLSRWTA